MANKYGVIRTDLMRGTDVGPNLVSVRFMDAEGKPAEIENGSVVKLNGLLDGERELYKGTAPEASTAKTDIAVIASPEVLYDERKKNLDEFINEAGANARGYILSDRNIFSLSAEALNIADGATPAVGWVVELMAGTKLNAVASATSGSTQIGKIIEIEKTSRYTYYVIETV
jgi:hypothetical protein